MSEMNIIESAERVREGLKIAASRARELAAAQGNPSWLQVALNLDELRHNAEKIIQSRSLSRQAVLEMADRIAASEAVH